MLSACSRRSRRSVDPADERAPPATRDVVNVAKELLVAFLGNAASNEVTCQGKDFDFVQNQHSANELRIGGRFAQFVFADR